jgi:hypothetical protein
MLLEAHNATFLQLHFKHKYTAPKTKCFFGVFFFLMDDDGDEMERTK